MGARSPILKTALCVRTPAGAGLARSAPSVPGISAAPNAASATATATIATSEARAARRRGCRRAKASIGATLPSPPLKKLWKSAAIETPPTSRLVHRARTVPAPAVSGSQAAPDRRARAPCALGLRSGRDTPRAIRLIALGRAPGVAVRAGQVREPRAGRRRGVGSGDGGSPVLRALRVRPRGAVARDALLEQGARGGREAVGHGLAHQARTKAEVPVLEREQPAVAQAVELRRDGCRRHAENGREPRGRERLFEHAGCAQEPVRNVAFAAAAGCQHVGGRAR